MRAGAPAWRLREIAARARRARSLGNGAERRDEVAAGAVQAVDREVAGEHAPIRPEDLDRLEDDWPQALNRPVVVRHAEARELHAHVRLAGEPLHAPPPSFHPLPTATGSSPGPIPSGSRPGAPGAVTGKSSARHPRGRGSYGQG